MSSTSPDTPGNSGIYVDKHADLISGDVRGREKIFDLTLGACSIGMPPELPSKMAELLTSDLENSGKSEVMRSLLMKGERYNHDVWGIKPAELLINHWQLPISTDFVTFNSNGSYGMEDEILRAVRNTGVSGIVATTYSFPNPSAEQAHRHQLTTEQLVGDTLFPFDSWKKMLAESCDVNNKVIFIDMPNNPFGLFDEELAHDVIEYTSRNGGIPLLDIAFGDVMDKAAIRDLINHTYNAGGAIVGSLSKTYGLAGHRIGWGIVSNQLVEKGYHKHNREKLVFSINELGRLAIEALFTPDSKGVSLADVHAARVAEYNITTNNAFYEALSKMGVTVLPTDLRTGIQVITDGKQGLYERLENKGVLTESLGDYSATIPPYTNRQVYGNSAVRILTPSPGELEPVLIRIEKAVLDA